jgi:hypothetical protein
VKNPVRFLAEKYPGIGVFELIRYSQVFYPKEEARGIAAAADLLSGQGRLNDLVGILNDKIVELSQAG